MTIQGQLSPATPVWPVRAACIAAASASTAAVLLVIYLSDGAFFLIDDKRNQYLPVAMDIGRRIRSGEWLPVIDPDLGPSGNYALDIQYGVFEPTHWIVAIGLSWLSNLELAGFVWALCFAVVLAAGTAALSCRLGMSGAWPAVAGFAVATSGWVLFWLAPDWIPGLVSLAWLPWLWWAWVGIEGRPRVRDCIGIAAFSYLVVASGWPSTWLAAGALVVGLGIETGVRRPPGSSRRGWLGQLAIRAGASLAGVLSAAVSLVPLYAAETRHFTVRQGAIANDNHLIVNLWDVASFAAPQLTGDVFSFGGSVTFPTPVFFAGWFAVVVLWCVRWDRALVRRPGNVTAAVGCACMVLMTQAPSSVGPLRDQIRQLGGAQFFFVIGTCALASAGSWVVTKTRFTGVVLSTAAMGWISWSRAPGAPHSLVGIGAVLVAAVLLTSAAARLPRLTAPTALATTVALTLVAFALYHARGSVLEAPEADRLTPGRLALSVADEPIFAVYGAGDPTTWATWQADGVGRAFSDLRATGRVAPGYSSVSQRAFRERFCITAAQGQGCLGEVDRLFEQEPQTQVPWIDLLGYRTVVVAGAAEQSAFERLAGAGWHPTGEGTDFTAYQRSGRVSVAGRITDVIGGATVSAESISNETQTYRVASAQGADLVFRDLYWPGYQAALDGRRLPVRPLDGMLVSVRLPPGVHGQLTVSYDPISTRAMLLLPAASVVLLATVCGVVVVSRRRQPSTSTGVDGDEEAAEPHQPQTL